MAGRHCIQRRRQWRDLSRRFACGMAIALVAMCWAAHAHETAPPQQVRELVRMQGYRTPAPQGSQVARELTLVALGRQVRFAATEWRVFAFNDPTTKPRPDPPQVTLQGERALLYSITSARTDQRITVLAERRPGSADLFVLSVDLCPAQ
jgi:hypothetical protein